MPLFETSRAAALTPGPHIIDLATPNQIQPVTANRVGYPAQFDWGPVLVAYEPSDVGDFIKTFFPAGSPRTSTGWLGATGRRKVPWTPVRVLGGSQGILPPLAPTIAPITPSTKTYKYLVVANNAAGSTQAGAWAITTTGQDDLTVGSHGNVVTWAAVPGATTYDLYRVYAGGATTNTTGRVSAAINGLTFTDVGVLANSGLAPPSANTTGWTQAVTDIYDSSTATATNSTAGNAVVRVIWKFPGTLPNSAGTVVTSAATNGDANAFNLAVAFTDALTGSSGEKFLNLKDVTTIALPTDLSGNRTSSTSTTVKNSNFIDTILLIGTPAARPADATWLAFGGSNGSAIAAADYNNALTALAVKTNIRVVVADDCGDSIRTAVNADIATHIATKTDRLGILTSNQADSWTTIKGNSGNGVGVQRDRRLRYYPWVNVIGVDGVEHKSPAGTFVASLTASNPTAQPDAWWDDSNNELISLGAISSLDTSQYNPMDETIQGDATTLGIGLIITLPNGRYTLLHDRTTSLKTAELFNTTQKIRLQWALDLKSGLAPWTNGPNDDPEQREADREVNRYIKKAAKKKPKEVATANADLLAQYPEFAAAGVTVGKPMFFTNITTPNDADSIAAGEFAIALNAITPSVMEKIFVLFNVGTVIQST